MTRETWRALEGLRRRIWSDGKAVKSQLSDGDEAREKSRLALSLCVHSKTDDVVDGVLVRCEKVGIQSRVVFDEGLSHLSSGAG